MFLGLRAGQECGGAAFSSSVRGLVWERLLMTRTVKARVQGVVYVKLWDPCDVS
jgi:hypothetical protein